MPATDPHYTVVVGLGGDAGANAAALRWAAEQAHPREGRVVAVRAWRVPAPQATPSGTTAERVSRSGDAEARARARLAADVADALPDASALAVEQRLVRGPRRQALLDTAQGADLVVLGGPATGSRPLFASRIIAAAPCPVVVVPGPQAGTPR